MAKRYMRIGDENAAAEGADGPAEEEAPKADIAYHAERIGAELTRTLRRFGTASRDAHDDAAVPEDDQAPRALVFAPKQAAARIFAAAIPADDGAAFSSSLPFVLSLIHI